MYHYVYIITNLINNKKYFGVRSSKVLPELDTRYYGSSVSLKSSIKRNGKHNFSKEIFKTFMTREEAYLFEDSYLKEKDLASNPMWYNLTNNTCNIKANYGWEEEARLKFSEKLKGVGHHNHKKANIYNISTNELIAENVCLRDWCRQNPEYDRTRLQRVARYYTYGSTSIRRGYTYAEKSHKGIYAIYTNEQELTPLAE